jgi:hypothetical protein
MRERRENEGERGGWGEGERERERETPFRWRVPYLSPAAAPVDSKSLEDRK